jgi:cytochrome c peroxidase
VYNVELNPPTEKGFELEKLFYDRKMSSDGIVSCGFCHIQEDAFTHHGHTLSHGIDNLVGDRNTPSIQNLTFQPLLCTMELQIIWIYYPLFR